MTEAEWRTATEPTPMLEFLRDKASERKMRLFVCGICRRHERQIATFGFPETLEAIEQYADGLISQEELTTVSRTRLAPWHVVGRTNRTRQHAHSVLYRLMHSNEPMFLVATIALQGFSGKKAAVRRGRTRLLREIFDNPFRPVVFSRDWRTDTALTLASQMYESRDFSAMPILADALQDAGCDSADILDHCRGPGPHVRGCWVVDLVLGKT